MHIALIGYGEVGRILAEDLRRIGARGMGDNFWQFDAFVGYRFLHRTAEITLGVLNLTDQDYRLNPLNSYGQRPRERTLMIRFGLHF